MTNLYYYKPVFRLRAAFQAPAKVLSEKKKRKKKQVPVEVVAPPIEVVETAERDDRLLEVLAQTEAASQLLRATDDLLEKSRALSEQLTAEHAERIAKQRKEEIHRLAYAKYIDDVLTLIRAAIERAKQARIASDDKLIFELMALDEMAEVSGVI